MYEVRFAICDVRQPGNRVLARPSPGFRAGLNTRTSPSRPLSVGTSDGD